MSELTALMFSYGFLDCLNPATITFMVTLLASVKKKWHALLFVFGVFTSYFTTGFLAYLGVDKYLKKFFITLIINNSKTFAIIEFVAAFCLLSICIILVIKVIKIIINKEKKAVKPSPVFDLTSPYFILGISLLVTIGDALTALPYVAFIATLISKNLTIAVSAIYLITFCLIYVTPIILLFVLYRFLNGKIFKKIELFMKNFMNMMSEYVMPFMLLVMSYFIFMDGLARF